MIFRYVSAARLAPSSLGKRAPAVLLARSLAGQAIASGGSSGPLAGRASERPRFSWTALWQGKRAPFSFFLIFMSNERPQKKGKMNDLDKFSSGRPFQKILRTLDENKGGVVGLLEVTQVQGSP